MSSALANNYRLLIESIVDYAIYMLDVNGHVVSWNLGAERCKGYKESEAIGMHFSRFYTEEDRAAGVPASALERAVEDGRFEAEGWRVRKNGSLFWAHVLIDPIRDDAGDLVGFAKVTRDLTERKAAEESKREEQAQFKMLVQGVTDYAIFLLDPTGHVSSWNPGAQRIKGYGQDEIIGRHFSCFYTPRDQQDGEPEGNLHIASSTGRAESEGWRVRKDGSRFWAHVLIDRILDDQGNLAGFAKVTRDVTEQRKTAEELDRARESLFQSQKLESIGQLTGGVAHDFNNLLMTIIASLELIGRRVPDDPKLHVFLENAKAGALRGAALTERMLSFARKQELRPVPVNLGELVGGMSNLLQRSLGSHIAITTTFPLFLGQVFADHNQLELALMNLLVNARDAMPEGGEITISAQKEAVGPGHFTKLPEGDFIKLVVADQGEGMDEATLARATEPFFTTKGVGKGTGLGLSMVHGLAEQSGGRLIVRSQRGEGTQVEFWLPVASDSEVKTAEEEQAPVPQNQLETQVLDVLVVDDDTLVLATMVAQLEELGHHVTQSNSADQALETLQSGQHFDLVISDHAMPVMTGSQFAQHVRKFRPELPIILASGYAELPGNLKIDLPRLKKPFTQRELALAVEHAVSGVEKQKRI
jgi:PAS domain S-box-containing protein